MTELVKELGQLADDAQARAAARAERLAANTAAVAEAAGWTEEKAKAKTDEAKKAFGISYLKYARRHTKACRRRSRSVWAAS